MKKLLFLSTLVAIFALVPSVVLAQGGNGSGIGQGGGDQVRAQNPELHEGGTGPGTGEPQGNQVQNQLQVNTQNQGEDSQLKVNTQNKEESGFGEQGSANRSDTARQHMSRVAQEVEKLLESENMLEGIGQEVSDIAKQQKQAQVKIGSSLNQIEARTGFMKTLLGPDQTALKEMKQLMEQNQLRIKKLQELKAQIQNEGEDVQLETMIQAMVEQNTALQSQVLAEENVKSVLGWLLKLFN